MVLPSRLDCPLSLKTANMGNPGWVEHAIITAVVASARHWSFVLSYDCRRWFFGKHALAVRLSLRRSGRSA